MTVILSSAELHGLVDGFLEPERRADVLRRLASSPADRARVETWQEQSNIIRNAFGAIDQEPLPPSLNLAPLFQTGTDHTSGLPLTGSARIGRAKMATAILLAASLAAGWMTWNSLSSTQDLAEAQLRGTIDETLADRASSALANEAPSAGNQQVSRHESLATFRVPDLEPSGFSLTGAEATASMPDTLVFHYRNGRAERLVIGVARTDGASEAAPKLIGDSYSWHHRDKAFAIAGTVPPERLHDIALLLQDEANRD